MKDIIFGMAVGGVIGMLLYKNSSCAKQIYDKGEELIMNEIEHFDNQTSKSKKTKK